MVGRIIRVLLGFVVGCVAAGVALVLFVHTPAEFPEWPADRFIDTGKAALGVATHIGIFAAPFAFIATVYAYWKGISSATYAVVVGVLIALVGFTLQYWIEIVDLQAYEALYYALAAFIVTGIVGGFAYWVIAGPSPAEPAAKGGTGGSGDKTEKIGTGTAPFAIKKPSDPEPTKA